jgi:two-component system OmpR family sensor kinase
MRGWRPPLFLAIFGLVLVTLVVAQLAAAALLVIVRPPPPAAINVERVADEIASGAPTSLRVRPRREAPDAAAGPESTSGRFARDIAERLGVAPGSVRVELSRMQRDRYILVDIGPPGEMRIAPTLVGQFQVHVRSAAGDWSTYRPVGEGIFDAVEMRYVLLFLIAAALMLPLAWWLSRLLARPFTAFADNAERVGRDPSVAVAPVSGPAEVARASEALAAMARRLHAYVTDRTQMIGALAHDFRTPLMRIGFRIDSLDPAIREAIAEDVGQLDSMVAATLAFVRGEQALAARDRVELSSLVESVADSLAWMERRVAVTRRENLVVDADVVALRRLFSNLIENALTYGNSADIRIAARDGEAVVDILDQGPGLAESELVRVFEPFYRAEPSRNRATGGMGLGLPLAARIATAHGGSLTLSNRPAGGLRARVRLPLATPARAPSGASAGAGRRPSAAQEGHFHGGPEAGIGAGSR